MNTQSIAIPSSDDADRLPESSAAATDHPHSTHQAGGPRILRRWSVAELIARAGGAPRAFA